MSQSLLDANEVKSKELLAIEENDPPILKPPKLAKPAPLAQAAEVRNLEPTDYNVVAISS